MPRVTISRYVSIALAGAKYEYCHNAGDWCAWVEEVPGCWSQADTVEEARAELAEVIEGWLILCLEQGDPIPELGGRSLGRRKPERALEAITA